MSVLSGYAIVHQTILDHYSGERKHKKTVRPRCLKWNNKIFVVHCACIDVLLCRYKSNTNAMIKIGLNMYMF